MNDNAEYHAYLKSPAWKARRLELIAVRGAKCEICASKGKLHLHHLTYVRLYDELDTDLAVLCDECHMAVHGKWGLVRKRAAQRAVKARTALIADWRGRLPDRRYIPPPPKVERPDLKDLYSVKAITRRRPANA